MLTFAPQTEEEAASLFAFCSKVRSGGSRFTVSLTGGYAAAGGCSLEPAITIDGAEDLAAHAAADEDIPIMLSAERFDSISEISAPDLLAVSGSGIKLSTLGDEVSKAGLFLPVDPELFQADDSLADLVMSGAVSRYEGRYGRFREYILSIRIVTPSGKIIHSGSRSVKDVAGYEIPGLVIGAGSRYGMITSLTLRLLPRPGTMAVCAARGGLEELGSLARKVHEGMSPAAIELFGSGMAEILYGAGSEKRSSQPLMVCEIHDSRRGMEKEIFRVFAEKAAGSGLEIIEDASIDQKREGLLDNLLRTGSGAVSIAGEREEGKKGRSDGVSGSRRYVILSADMVNVPVPDAEDIYWWSSFFPGRSHYIWPADAGGAPEMHEEAARILADNLTPGSRISASILESAGNGPAGSAAGGPKEAYSIRKIWPDRDGEGMAAELYRLGSGKEIEDIESKVAAVFDPAGIMRD